MSATTVTAQVKEITPDVVHAAFAELLYQNETLRDEVEVLRSTNAELSRKINRGSELFGKAFAQAQPEVGPQRPNRKKLSPREVRDIRQAYRGGATQRELAYMFEVNPATISRTVRGIYH